MLELLGLVPSFALAVIAVWGRFAEPASRRVSKSNEYLDLAKRFGRRGVAGRELRAQAEMEALRAAVILKEQHEDARRSKRFARWLMLGGACGLPVAVVVTFAWELNAVTANMLASFFAMLISGAFIDETAKRNALTRDEMVDTLRRPSS